MLSAKYTCFMNTKFLRSLARFVTLASHSVTHPQIIPTQGLASLTIDASHPSSPAIDLSS